MEPFEKRALAPVAPVGELRSNRRFRAGRAWPPCLVGLNRMRWIKNIAGVVSLTTLSTLLQFGCGGNVSEDVSEDATRRGSSSVAFSTDFPEIYGEIAIEVEGFDAPIDLVGGAGTSCAAPALSTDAQSLRYRATSSNGFTWEATADLPSITCNEIELAAGASTAAFYALFENDPQGFPITVFVDGKPVGVLTQPWDPDPINDLKVQDCASWRTYFLEAAREGKAVIVPLTEERVTAEYYFEYASSAGTARGYMRWKSGACILAIG